jgi:hypothetical protein
MPRVSEQIEWLSLVDVSGPFLAPAVLEEAFPQGLEKVVTPRRQRIRSAYEEWRDAVDADDAQLPEIHAAWVRMVLQDMLEYEDTVLVSRQALNGKCVYRAPEHGVEAAPDYAIRGDDGEYRLLIAVWPPETDLEKVVSSDPWPVSPLERMTLLCRANDVRVGLVTDGERWMVVNAPVGATSGYAAWLARLWWQEPITLKAFQSLLGVRRCFGPKNETLDALLERSIEFQEEVTDTLGEQVRRAVEILVQSLGRADQDRNGELLKDVSPTELYEAGLTVMMRLVFTLCAEERGLLLLGDPVYDQNYAISTLRARLREDADRFGVEVLERRHDAWSRLLAVFRAIYGGIEHEALRMPALGGSLFDPDRFPLLEGRAKGTTWRRESSNPLPIDNRTVLLLLDALQVLEQRGGAQLLSYRALDVEQIGHVYEGLLEYTVAKLDMVTVGLVGSQKVRHPLITLNELETLLSQGQDNAVKHLAELTGRSATAISNALTYGGNEAELVQLLHACGGDDELARRLLPYARLIRMDSWGTMLIYKPDSFAVVHGSDRRDTGTHYTPKSLAESIVEQTLEPVVYIGPADGEARERWRLKTSAEILDLKVCDPAMGSGAFLVQVCRYLAERLVEAWTHEERKGEAITVDGVAVDSLNGAEPMPKSLDERVIIARRLIAERCLYGVDINPLAVELAKLSIWLVTMAKGRPFGFLNHNLRSGDSLLGIHRLDQLTKLTLEPDKPGHQERLFGRDISRLVAEAIKIRCALRAIPIRDIRDVEAMARLDAEVRHKLNSIELVADAMIGAALANCAQPKSIPPALDALAIQVSAFLGGSPDVARRLAEEVRTDLSRELPRGGRPRTPCHWPLAFPEVFLRDNPGFDAIIGNPPFLGGKRISSATGPMYNTYITLLHRPANKNTDLCAHFFRRAFTLLRANASFGLLSVNTIAEGDARQGGLEWMLKHEAVIYAAYPNEPWPGKAAVITSRVHVRKGGWQAPAILGGKIVSHISAFLSPQDEWSPKPLASNRGIAFQGSIVLGMGFIITNEEAIAMISANPANAEVLFPYLNGDDLNSDPRQAPSRWVINFWDWPEAKAARYREPFELIKQRVRPERLEKSRSSSYRNIMSMWWKHWNVRTELYHSVGRGHCFASHPKRWDSTQPPLRRVLAISRVSKTGAFVFVRNDAVFSDAIVVFASDDPWLFAVLQSSLHVAFAWKHASRLKADLRYTPSDILETFPFPSHDAHGQLASLGESFHQLREALMAERMCGLTTLYHSFHDPAVLDASLARLRDLHRRIDEMVARSYGWDDIDLEHDFHRVAYLPEHCNLRFTISESARTEILRRLSLLNQQRHQQECLS